MDIEKLPKFTCHFCLNSKFNDKLYKICHKPLYKTNVSAIVYCHKDCLPKYHDIFNDFLNKNNIKLDIDTFIHKKIFISNTLLSINKESENEFNKGLSSLEKMSEKYKIDNYFYKDYLEFLICISYWNF